MSKLSILFLFVLFFLIPSCLFDNGDDDWDDSYKIEYGFACGWCGGTGFIEIIQEQISYEREIPCGENEGIHTESDNLISEQWEELISSYNHADFLKLDYSQCNVCVDGCDEIIRITKDDQTHELRYNPGDTIPGIKVLQEKLRMMMSEYQDN